MAEYFENLPNTLYTLDSTPPVNPILVKNITARAKVIARLSSTVYYKYQIKEGETPEIIAFKYYVSPGRHWIVLYANNIVDPQYDWPLGYSAFDKFIVNKYTSDALAKTTVHHYEKTITKTYSGTGTITENVYEIDATAYALLPNTETVSLNLVGGSTVQIVTTRSIVYCYDYEERLNNEKRNIRLIDKSYVSRIEAELESIFL